MGAPARSTRFGKVNLVTQFDGYMYHTCQTHQSPLGLMAREENAIRILRTICSRDSLEVSWWGRATFLQGKTRNSGSVSLSVRLARRVFPLSRLGKPCVLCYHDHPSTFSRGQYKALTVIMLAALASRIGRMPFSEPVKYTNSAVMTLDADDALKKFSVSAFESRGVKPD